MMTKNRALRLLLIFSGIILFLFLLMQPLLLYTYRDSIDVLFPSGLIGIEQRNLLLILQAVMLIVIIPVYILTFIFSWRYRAHHSKATYDPDLVDSSLAEYIWWGLPIVLTIAVSILTWVKTHELDPFKPIESTKPPIHIQAVALQWKWLFLYPEENIATVNFVQFPEQTPLHFEITADAPMNSLWIPALGGQIYAMPNMKTQLYLIADTQGDFRGSSANISGDGFAGMHFIARASSEEDYRKWVDSLKESENDLSKDKYAELAAPSKDNPPENFRLSDPSLFQHILMKYMHPQEPE